MRDLSKNGRFSSQRINRVLLVFWFLKLSFVVEWSKETLVCLVQFGHHANVLFLEKVGRKANSNSNRKDTFSGDLIARSGFLGSTSFDASSIGEVRQAIVLPPLCRRCHPNRVHPLVLPIRRIGCIECIR